MSRLRPVKNQCLVLMKLSSKMDFRLGIFILCVLLWPSAVLCDYPHKTFNFSLVSPEDVSDIIIPSYLKSVLEQFNDPRPDYTDNYFEGVDNKKCIGHIAEFMRRLGNVDNLLKKDQWVVQMADAWGKFPEGILRGHVNSWGDFVECVAVETDTIKATDGSMLDSFDGMHCNVFMGTYEMAMEDISVKPPLPPKSKRSVAPDLESSSVEKKKSDTIVSIQELLTMLFKERVGQYGIAASIGTCLPNSCSQRDIQQIFVNFAKINYNKIPGLPDDPEGLPWPYIMKCYDRHKPDFTAGDISVIALLSILGALCLTAGVLDYVFKHYTSRPAPVSLVWHYLMAFSLYTNIKKWAKVTRSPEGFGCLHGLRFLSMAWIILAHTYQAIVQLPPWDSIKATQAYENWTILAVINGFFAVDTFFVMGGMLVTYNLLKILQKSNGKFNVAMFYVHRYIRITPTYAILLGITATIIPYLGSGPYWFNVEVQAEDCRNNWWTNLLYINNFVNPVKMCIGESWYLTNDMQFYILSPLIIYPIWKWEKIGLGLLGVYTVLSLIAPVVTILAWDTISVYIIPRDLGVHHEEVYIKPYARIQIYLVGMWLGWLLIKTRGKKIRLSSAAQAWGWVLSTALALTLIFSIYPWFNPENNIQKFWGLVYAGLSRFGWGLVISWIIFASVKGYGGIVNKFLSWSPFVPLARLCFCTYLTAAHLQYVFHSRFTQPLQFDTYTIVHFYFAHLLMSLMVGFVCTLVFESPFIILQKLIFDGSPKPKTKAKPVDQEANIGESKRTD